MKRDMVLLGRVVKGQVMLGSLGFYRPLVRFYNGFVGL